MAQIVVGCISDVREDNCEYVFYKDDYGHMVFHEPETFCYTLSVEAPSPDDVTMQTIIEQQDLTAPEDFPFTDYIVFYELDRCMTVGIDFYTDLIVELDMITGWFRPNQYVFSKLLQTISRAQVHGLDTFENYSDQDVRDVVSEFLCDVFEDCSTGGNGGGGGQRGVRMPAFDLGDIR